MHESCHPNRGVVQQSINTHTHTHTHPLTHYPWNCPFLRLFGHTHTTDTDTDVDTDTHMKETHPSCDCVISSSNESRYKLSVLLGSPAIDSSRLCVAICFSVFQYVAVFYTCVECFTLGSLSFDSIRSCFTEWCNVLHLHPQLSTPSPQRSSRRILKNTFLHILWGTWRNARTWVSQQGQGALANGQRYDSRFLRLLGLLGGRERAKQGQLP